MADTDISPVVDRLVTRIRTVANIGAVWPFDPNDPGFGGDLGEWLHSDIDGVNTLRAWWISGPSLGANWLTALTPHRIERNWNYQITGVEGMTPGTDGDTRVPGQAIQTLRDNALAVIDAIDSDDLDLGQVDPGDGLGLRGRVHSSEPCYFEDPPRHVLLGGRYGVAQVVIRKPCQTVPLRLPA